MAVILESQRAWEIRLERLKPPEMTRPFSVVEIRQTDICCPAIVAEAQLRLREIGSFDRRGKPICQRVDCGIGAVH